MGTEMLRRFLVVIEETGGVYSAYSPDLPGCVATGDTVNEVEQNMYEAMEMHIQGLIEDNAPVPEAHSTAEYIVVKQS